jgi:hypothetical protein
LSENGTSRKRKEILEHERWGQHSSSVKFLNKVKEPPNVRWIHHITVRLPEYSESVLWDQEWSVLTMRSLVLRLLSRDLGQSRIEIAFYLEKMIW